MHDIFSSEFVKNKITLLIWSQHTARVGTLLYQFHNRAYKIMHNKLFSFLVNNWCMMFQWQTLQQVHRTLWRIRHNFKKWTFWSSYLHFFKEVSSSRKIRIQVLTWTFFFKEFPFSKKLTWTFYFKKVAFSRTKLFFVRREPRGARASTKSHNNAAKNIRQELPAGERGANDCFKQLSSLQKVVLF